MDDDNPFRKLKRIGAWLGIFVLAGLGLGGGWAEASQGIIDFAGDFAQNLMSGLGNIF
jgi:hypothetical protein